MAVLTDYSAGTITLTNGSANFTTSGAALQTAAIAAGDSIFCNGFTAIIASITGQNAGTLTANWAPATQTAQAYRIRYQADNSRYTATARDLITLLAGGNLSAEAALDGTPGDKVSYYTGAGTKSLADFTSLGRSIVGATDSDDIQFAITPGWSFSDDGLTLSSRIIPVSGPDMGDVRVDPLIYRPQAAWDPIHNEHTSLYIGYPVGGQDSNYPGDGSGHSSTLETRYNVGVGSFALYDVTTGSYLTAVGHEALRKNTVGAWSTGLGEAAGCMNQEGDADVWIGWKAGHGIDGVTNASRDVAIGYSAMFKITTGINDVAIGYNTMGSVANPGISGSGDTVVGATSGGNITTANNDSVFGYNAANVLISGGSNLLLGAFAGNTTGGLFTSGSTVTISISSPAAINFTNHHRSVDDPIVFDTDGALPTGLTAGTMYFVKTIINADNFMVSATVGGAAINTSGTQSGTHTAYAAGGSPPDGVPIGFAISIASPGVVGFTDHGLAANTPIAFSNFKSDFTGHLPTGLAVGTTYFVKTVLDADRFTVSATAGGTAINTTGSQSGIHSLYTNGLVTGSGDTIIGSLGAFPVNMTQNVVIGDGVGGVHQWDTTTLIRFGAGTTSSFVPSLVINRSATYDSYLTMTPVVAAGTPKIGVNSLTPGSTVGLEIDVLSSGSPTAIATFSTTGLDVAGNVSANDFIGGDFDGGAGVFSGSITAADITVGNTGLHILDTNASHDLIVKPGSNITADRTLTITTGDANRTLDFNGGDITGPVTSAGFTPTLTNTLNLDASTAVACAYSRNGNEVVVRFSANVDPTATGAVTLKMSLPIASNLGGTSLWGGGASTLGEAVSVVADATNDLAQIQLVATSTANHGIQGMFGYTII